MQPSNNFVVCVVTKLNIGHFMTDVVHTSQCSFIGT